MPLAHILMPQVLKKAQQIQTALSPTQPVHPVFGDVEKKDEYRQQIDESQRNGRGSFERGFEEGTAVHAGYLKNDPKYLEPETYGAGRPMSRPIPLAPKGTLAPQGTQGGYLGVKTEPKRYDPNAPGGAIIDALGKLQRSGPKGKELADQIMRGMDRPTITMLPNAPVPAPIEAKPTKNKRGRIVVTAKPGEPFGVNERGESIDSRGKNLGYLNQPSIVTPYGDVPIRTGERRQSDVSQDQRDPFAIDVLERQYGEHLKAMEENRTPNGLPTDQFPKDYFKGMSKEERKNIEKGVDALRDIRRGTRV